MIKVDRYKLGCWKARIEAVLDKCAGKIPDIFAMVLEITVRDIEEVVKQEQIDWDKQTEEIRKGDRVRL